MEKKSSFWHIKKEELKKVIPLSCMMFCIIFIYSLCRDLKDTLIVSKAVNGGAETIGFIKIFVVAPVSILFLYVFFKLVKLFSRNAIFTFVVSVFLVFFFFFGFVFYPHAQFLHLSPKSITTLQELFPHLYWFWPVIGNWTFSLFYVMSEMWGAVVLSALFWQTANSVTTIEESKRHYSFFGIIGNLGLIASGSSIILFANIAKRLQSSFPSQDPFLRNIKYQMLTVTFMGMVLLFLYEYFFKNNQVVKNHTDHKNDDSLTFIHGIKKIFSSKHLVMLVIMIISYGISMNLLEFIWKEQVRLYYSDTNDFHSMMGRLSLLTGIVTLISMFAGSYILTRFSWKTSALITPYFLFISSAIFFVAILYENNVGIDAKIFGTRVIFVVVILGLLREAITRGVKYSLFDSTKQMVYIPLNEELKTKGQAVVEIVGGRFGKLSGAGIQSIVLMVIGGGVSLSSVIEVFGVIIMVFIFLWIAAIYSLNEIFEKKE